MKIHGQTIPEAAIAAGLAAMRDEFTSTTVENAMWPHVPEGRADGWSRRGLTSEAANRLLQRERKAGRVAYDRASMTWSRTDRMTETEALAELGRRLLAEALRSVDWHNASVRVASPPRMSLGIALEIVREAKRLGIGGEQ